MKPLDHRIGPDAETIGGLFTQLVDDAKNLFHAEIGYYRTLATGRVAGLKVAAILLVLALFLLQASLTTLLVGLGLAIARLIERGGIAAGVLIAAVIGLVITGLLVWIAVGRIGAATKAAGEVAK